MPPEFRIRLKVRSGRRPELGRLAAFRCRAALERHAERKDCRTLPQRTTWRNFIFRSPKVTSLQPQPIALKPASIQEVASRTLARRVDKSEKQRGRKAVQSLVKFNACHISLSRHQGSQSGARSINDSASLTSKTLPFTKGTPKPIKRWACMAR